MVLFHALTLYYFKIDFNIIFPYTPIFRRWYFYLGIMQTVCKHFTAPISAEYSTELHLLCLMQIVSQCLSFNTGAILIIIFYYILIQLTCYNNLTFILPTLQLHQDSVCCLQSWPILCVSTYWSWSPCTAASLTAWLQSWIAETLTTKST